MKDASDLPRIDALDPATVASEPEMPARRARRSRSDLAARPHLAAVVAAASCLVAAHVPASPWGVVANHLDRTIRTVDLGTTPPTMYGPFLAGQLGASALDDLAITPDTRYALVTSYYGCSVFRIDITDPTLPVLAGTLALPVIPGASNPTCFTPMDVAIAPNGQFAIVSSGRSLVIPPQPPTNRIGIIDLATFTYTTTYTLTTPNGSAQAVAIAADNQTVVLVDRAGGASAVPFPGRIIFGAINPAIGLVSESTLPTGDNSYPINVAISPDGQTVLVAGATALVNVFRIAAPGVGGAGATPAVAGLPGRQQSLAFAPDGLRAYTLSTTPIPHQLSWVQVNGPGNVTLGGASVAALLTSGNLNRALGMDIVSVAPGGAWALVGNPSLPGDTTTNSLVVVGLPGFGVTTVPTGSSYPVGLDTFQGVASVTTAAVSGITWTTAAGGGTVVADAVRPPTVRGVCWGASADPTTADTCTSDGSGAGSFASALGSLAPGATYHVRAYATNAAGTAYGGDVVFTTSAAVPPSVTTAPVIWGGGTSASSGGTVTLDGGLAVTARGVCWSATGLPTTADPHTLDGAGVGGFASSLGGLVENTTYRVRAYATNDAGTSYGGEVAFATNVVPVLSRRGAYSLAVLLAVAGLVVLRRRALP